MSIHDSVHSSKLTATFEPDSLKRLAAAKLPLYCEMLQGHGGFHMRLERSLFMAKYLICIWKNLPIADMPDIGTLPGPNADGKSRAKHYMQSIKLLQSYHECDSRCKLPCQCAIVADKCLRHGNTDQQCHLQGKIDWSKPRLVTRRWLSQMERIKRRFTTNGGNSTELLDFLVQRLEQQPSFVDYIEAREAQSRDGKQAESVRKTVTDLLRKRFLFSDQYMEIFWKVAFCSKGWEEDSAEEIERMICAELQAVVKQLVGFQGGTWIHCLSDFIHEVDNMLCEFNLLYDIPVIVLELGTDHPFWNKSFELTGE